MKSSVDHQCAGITGPAGQWNKKLRLNRIIVLDQESDYIRQKNKNEYCPKQSSSFYIESSKTQAEYSLKKLSLFRSFVLEVRWVYGSHLPILLTNACNLLCPVVYISWITEGKIRLSYCCAIDLLRLLPEHSGWNLFNIEGKLDNVPRCSSRSSRFMVCGFLFYSSGTWIWTNENAVRQISSFVVCCFFFFMDQIHKLFTSIKMYQ